LAPSLSANGCGAVNADWYDLRTAGGLSLVADELMSTPLQTQISRLRRRVRWLLVVQGLSSMLAVVLLAAIIAIGIDWSLQIDDSLFRASLLAAVLITMAAAVQVLLIAPLLVPLDDLTLATRIESLHPHLGSRLSSGIQFSEDLRDWETGGGSGATATLMRMTIQQATAAMATVDIRNIVRPRTAHHAMAGLVVVAAFGLVMTLYNPLAAGTGFNRLFMLDSTSWPRSVDLQFVDDLQVNRSWDVVHGVRLPAGEPLNLRVVNTRGRLPDSTIIELGKPASHRDTIQVLSSHPVSSGDVTVLMTGHGDPSASRIGHATLLPPEDLGRLAFRAVGGDDRTDWIPLLINPPPQLTLLQVELYPPADTGKPHRSLPPGRGDIEGLVGTRAEITAVVSQPIQSATLLTGDHPPSPVSIAEDGQTLKASLRISAAGVSYWALALVDADGLSVERPSRFEVRGILDRLPSVQIEHPTGPVQATSRALVPLRVVVHDDHGVREVRLVIRSVSDPNLPVRHLVLHPAHHGSNALVLQHSWQLNQPPLGPAREWAFHVEAVDLRNDPDSPRVGRSVPMELTIVTPEAKREELENRLHKLSVALGHVLDRQQIANQQVDQLWLQWNTAGRLRPSDLTDLQRIEFAQQQVRSAIAEDKRGLAARAAALNEEREGNKIDDRQAADDLAMIAHVLMSLDDHELPGAETLLAEARRLADAVPAAVSLTHPAATPLGHSLLDVRRLQGRVTTAIEELLLRLKPAVGRREQLARLRRLIDDQQRISSSTASRPSDTLDKPVGQLTQQQQADIRKLAKQQANLAVQLDRFLKRTPRDNPEHSSQSPSRDHSYSKAAGDAFDSMAGTVGGLSESAEKLSVNKVGTAHLLQQQALDELHQLARVLFEEAQASDRRRLGNVDQLANRIRLLSSRQVDLRRETSEGLASGAREPIRNGLAKRQLALADRAERAVNDARMTGIIELVQVARQAEGDLRDAHASLETKTTDPERLLAQQDRAIDSLASFHQRLLEAQRRVADTLESESRRTTIAQLSVLRRKQTALLADTRTLRAQQQQRGRWTRPLLKRLSALKRRQEGLKAAISRLATVPVPRREKQPPGSWMSPVLEAMQVAVSKLMARRLGDDTQRAQQLSVSLMDQVLAHFDAAPAPHRDRGTKPTHGDQAGDAGTRPMNSTPSTPGKHVTDTRPGSAPATTAGRSQGTPSIDQLAGPIRQRTINSGSWAELPDSVRKRLAQTGRQQAPSRYSGLVRRYYESLSRWSDPRPRIPRSLSRPPRSRTGSGEDSESQPSGAR